MAIVVIEGVPTQEMIESAREEYQTYIKIAMDIVQERVALGGEYHADAEKLLLEKGSKQKDIWGGGPRPDEDRITTFFQASFQGISNFLRK